MSIANEYLNSTIKRILYYKELGDKTFVCLDEADFHFQPNEESNSIAVIIQHVSGNMLSRWTNFLTSDGEKEWRNRDTEFETIKHSKEKLIEIWENGWQCFIKSLNALTESDLTKTIYIRSEPLSVIDAINRQLAHYPYHVGQIIYIAKVIKNNQWQSLSIPKNKSGNFNDEMTNKFNSK